MKYLVDPSGKTFLVAEPVKFVDDWLVVIEGKLYAVYFQSCVSLKLFIGDTLGDITPVEFRRVFSLEPLKPMNGRHLLIHRGCFTFMAEWNGTSELPKYIQFPTGEIFEVLEWSEELNPVVKCSYDLGLVPTAVPIALE